MKVSELNRKRHFENYFLQMIVLVIKFLLYCSRICNLELMVDYGCEAWKSYLEVLVQLVTQAQKQLQSMR